MAMALRVPSGRQRGRKKHVSPASVWARVRNPSLIGAEQNHLWPVIRYSSPERWRAVVVLARTSLPPCFSVIAMPQVSPDFCSAEMNRRS